MAKTDCETFENDLSALIDQELDSARRESIESHLAACSACRVLLDELRSQRAQLAAMPRIRAPESLAMFIRHRAERRALFGEAEAVPRGRFWLWFSRISASAALIMAGAFISWRLFIATHAPVSDSTVPGATSYENPRVARRPENPPAKLSDSPAVAARRSPEFATTARVEPDEPVPEKADVAPAVAAGDPQEEIPSEDTIAISCAPVTSEQYALLLSVLRQHATAVLMERAMLAALSRNRAAMPEPMMFDARRAETDQVGGQARSTRITLRVNAAVVPTYLALFEQIAPQCVRVNVPWSRREQIARVLFAQEPPEIHTSVRIPPSREVFAQTLESWLSREFRALRDEAFRSATRPAASAAANRGATMMDQENERPAAVAGRDVSGASPPELRVPETLTRLPGAVYRRGTALVQSLLGGLLGPESKPTPPDTILLDIEILMPSGAAREK